MSYSTISIEARVYALVAGLLLLYNPCNCFLISHLPSNPFLCPRGLYNHHHGSLLQHSTSIIHPANLQEEGDKTITSLTNNVITQTCTVPPPSQQLPNLTSLQKSLLHKQIGSKNYMKTWSHWMQATVQLIRIELSQILPHPVDSNMLEDLSYSLGVASDIGQMPSGFVNAGARSGYALEYFCRVRLLADLWMDMILSTSSRSTNISNTTEKQEISNHDDNGYSFWNYHHDESKMIHNVKSTSSYCNLVSLGGGPGFDFVAAALVSKFYGASSSEIFNNITPIHATILDYETGWQSLVEPMYKATTQVLLSPPDNTTNMSCTWGGKCDITQRLDHPSNAAVRQVMNDTHVWTCQYCVAENAIALRDSNFIFFRDLLKAVPIGAIFIVTETTPRLWPEFYKILLEEFGDDNDEYKTINMKIRILNRKGPHMIIQKTHRSNFDLTSVSISPVDLESMKDFEQYSKKQNELVKRGWIRQRRQKLNHIEGTN